jgi:hypothetical protein
MLGPRILKHLIGQNWSFHRQTNASGTVLFFEASAKREAMEDVRSFLLSDLLFCPMIIFVALYEADKAAHEEAIRNGGVSGVPNAIYILIAHLPPLVDPILVRDTRSDRNESRYLYLAEPETRNCG